MTERHFVDSNILVYRHDRDEADKQARAAAVMRALWLARSGRLSTQVLHEFYTVVTRKLARPVPRDVARREVRLLSTWNPIAPTPTVREQAWQVEDRYGLSWWDSLIVAAAKQAGCTYLLSEDLQDGQDLGGLIVVNPFVHDMAEFGLSE
jgi:predicted nucleic acid-binding protein